MLTSELIGTHQTPFIGVHLMLIQNNKILLQKRKGGHLDGWYSPVSGHVDKGENIIEALVREAKEEADIVLNATDLKIGVIGHLLDVPYKGTIQNIINFFIFTDKYEGIIQNKEPDKTESLAFYDINNLPSQTFQMVKKAIKTFQNGENFFVMKNSQ